VLLGGRELPAVAFTGIDLMSGVRLSLAEAFLYMMWVKIWGRKWHQEELNIREGYKDMRVSPWHMGRQLLLKDARVAQYLHRLVWQRNNFEPSGKGGVGMAHRGYRGVWGGIKIKLGYEEC
jgi:hypothetical protein